jgi:histone H3/H4
MALFAPIDPVLEAYRMAKKAAAKGGKKTAAKAEILVVGTKVKDVVKAAGLQSSGELIEAVSQRVHALLTSAVQRASDNNRKTVRPHDL